MVTDLFDRINAAHAEVARDIQKNAVVLCRDAGVGSTRHQEVGEQGMKVCLEIVKGLTGDLKLELANEDWNWLSGKAKPIMYEFNDQPRRTNMVRRTLKEVLDRDVDGAEYNCEKEWGVLPREPYNMGKKTKAQQIAEQLFEPFERGRREAFNELASEDVRKREAQKCKEAVKRFRMKYQERLGRRVPEIR